MKRWREIYHDVAIERGYRPVARVCLMPINKECGSPLQFFENARRRLVLLKTPLQIESL